MGAVRNFSHSIVSTKSLVTFARVVQNHVEPLKVDLFIERQIAAIKKILNEMDQAFQRVLISEFTEQLVVKDDRRDALIVALRAHLNAMVAQKVLNEKKAAAAEALLVHMNMMDSRVTSMGYLEESAEINAFLLAVKSLSEETITLSGANMLLSALEEAQIDFDTLFNAKDKAAEESSSPRQLRVIRSALVERIEAVLSYISINAIDLPEEYGSVVESLNGIIDEVMAKAKAEKTRKGNLAEAE